MYKKIVFTSNYKNIKNNEFTVNNKIHKKV